MEVQAKKEEPSKMLGPEGGGPDARQAPAEGKKDPPPKLRNAFPMQGDIQPLAFLIILYTKSDG
jgi:hypothetical protein